MSDESTATCIDILLAIILPPLGVFLKYGRVLDLCVADLVWMVTWNHLCCLCHHQVIYPSSPPISSSTLFRGGDVRVILKGLFISANGGDGYLRGLMDSAYLVFSNYFILFLGIFVFKLMG
ncbi:unnamed protein product [Camellia sinensis]